MALPAALAWILLPLVVPLCLYVAFTDLREMRITNQAVVALAILYAALAWIALPFEVYAWQLVHLPVMLVIGIVLNAAGVMGAGDAKFLAAAAPYLALPDWRIMLIVYMTTLLTAFAAHRAAKHSPLRRLAPHWDSWEQGKKFPMGLALGPTLIVYLILGAIYGA
ncbi:MAG: prepilin peptidase [Pseudomonadota bacterium]